MTTFEVTSGDLYAFANELRMLGSALQEVSNRTLGSAGSGSSCIEQALEGFKGHWSSTAALMGDDLLHLGQKVSAAADAYDETDAEIGTAASGGC